MERWIRAIKVELSTVVADMTSYEKGYSGALRDAISILEDGGDREEIKSEFEHWKYLYKTQGRDDFRGRRDALQAVLRMN